VGNTDDDLGCDASERSQVINPVKQFYRHQSRDAFGETRHPDGSTGPPNSPQLRDWRRA